MKKLNLKEAKKQITKTQLLKKLAKKNLKGGTRGGCPPPFDD